MDFNLNTFRLWLYVTHLLFTALEYLKQKQGTNNIPEIVFVLYFISRTNVFKLFPWQSKSVIKVSVQTYKQQPHFLFCQQYDKVILLFHNNIYHYFHPGNVDSHTHFKLRNMHIGKVKTKAHSYRIIHHSPHHNPKAFVFINRKFVTRASLSDKPAVLRRHIVLFILWLHLQCNNLVFRSD